MPIVVVTGRTELDRLRDFHRKIEQIYNGTRGSLPRAEVKAALNDAASSA